MSYKNWYVHIGGERQGIIDRLFNIDKKSILKVVRRVLVGMCLVFLTYFYVWKIFIFLPSLHYVFQVGSWFANRRNRSNNTRPKQNMKRLRVAIWTLCCEYQKKCNGLVNATEMQARILNLIERHTKF